MKKNFFFGIGCLALASCLLSACVDDKYDVNDMDMTIGSTSDLALPSLSTGSILLENIMDLSDDDIIKVQDGEFRLVTSGQMSPTETEVNPVTISKPDISPVHTTVKLNTNSGSARYRAAASIPDETFKYTIKDADRAYFEVNEQSNVISEDVIDVKSIIFGDDILLRSTLKLSFGNGDGFIKKIHLQNLSLSVPTDISFKKGELTYYQNGQLKTNQVSVGNGVVNISGANDVAVDAGQIWCLPSLLTRQV